MTQRIFDIENEEDMPDLWNIIPDWVVTIKKTEKDCVFIVDKNGIKYGSQCIKINWHDKTEITRPVNYKDMIGCVGWFDGYGDEIGLGILTKVAQNDKDGYCFLKNNNIWCKTFRPAKKSELKFWGD